MLYFLWFLYSFFRIERKNMLRDFVLRLQDFAVRVIWKKRGARSSKSYR